MDTLVDALGVFAQSDLGIAVCSLLLTGLVGNWIAVLWARRQKRRELDLAAATELYELYGEFLAIWKAWNAMLEHRTLGAGQEPPKDLLARSTKIEGRFESLLLRITSQQTFRPEDLADLGMLRQAFKFPRRQILEGIPIPWGCSEHPQYLAFKSTCSAVGARLAVTPWGLWPASTQAEQFLMVAQNNPHEENFAALGRPCCPSCRCEAWTLAQSQEEGLV